MAQPNTIDKDLDLKPGKDFNALLKIALDQVKLLASDKWTDYNEHDPGITILEQLAYGLTEIGYKADLPVQDLLCNVDGSIDADENFFYTAAHILTVNPVTISDYRKLLLDYFQEVSNAWIETAAVKKDEAATVYQVTVSLKYIPKDEQATQVKQTEIRQFLNKYRNFSEYFEKVRILKPHMIGVAGRIQLQHNANADDILEQVLLKLKGLIVPEVKHYTVDALLAEGRAVEDIFSGPVPRKGYIKAEELTDKIKEVNISQVLKEIMAVSNIGHIEELSFTSEISGHKYTSSKSVDISDQRVATFDADSTIKNLHFYSKKVEVFTSAVNAATNYYGKKHEDKSPYKLNTLKATLDILPPGGNYTAISQYYSIQNQFPQTYGLGQNVSFPTNSRKAKINQLRAYLAFFEQHMAGTLSQLANAKYLFNFKHIDRVNYSQSIIGSYEMDKVLEPDYLQKMDAFFNMPEKKEQRIHSFLKHVLSRFSEQAAPYNNKSHNEAETGILESKINTRLKLLRSFAKYSSMRARAPQYLLNDEGHPFQQELTGLELKIQCLLGIDEHISRSVFIIEHFLLKNNNTTIPPGFYQNTVSLIFILNKTAYHDKNYKQYITETVGHLFPAHLLPYTLFLNEDTPGIATDFRHLFREWVKHNQLSATEKTDGNIDDALAAFIYKNISANTLG